MSAAASRRGDDRRTPGTSRKRPRRICEVCGKNVALYANGTLWLHYVPGWGLWSERQMWCDGHGDPYLPLSVNDVR